MRASNLSPGPLWEAAHEWPEPWGAHPREGPSFSADQLVMLQGWGLGGQGAGMFSWPASCYVTKVVCILLYRSLLLLSFRDQ